MQQIVNPIAVELDETDHLMRIRWDDGHLGEWGLGSISETADGAAPHAATGCPFQAWSVAELLRVRRTV